MLSDQINAEYHRVISAANSSRKMNLEGFDSNLLLQLLVLEADWVEAETAPIIRSRDPHDDKFIAAALNGRADFLVTGDNDLLTLSGDSRLGTTRIVRPALFLTELEKIYS